MKACTKCGVEKPLEVFPPCPRTHDGREGRCVDCRAEYHRLRREQLREQQRKATPPSSKACTKCGETKRIEEFNRKASEVDGFCSWCKECHGRLPCRSRRARLEARRIRAMRKGLVHRSAASLARSARFREHIRRAEAAIEGRPVSEPTTYLRQCPCCATAFTTEVPRQKYCSTSCTWRDNRRRRRARMRKAFVEDVELADIYDRDGGVCQLCGERVDRRRSYPHPRTPVLDHIVPLSRGGEHSRANVQLAHHGCNNAKGARSWGSQLRLVG